MQPTPEIVIYTWVMALEYHIGTSAFALNAITAACETFGFELQNYFQKPPSKTKKTQEFAEDAQRARERAPVASGEVDSDPEDDSVANAGGNLRRKKKTAPRRLMDSFVASGPVHGADTMREPIMDKFLSSRATSSSPVGAKLVDIEERRKQLECIRRERTLFRQRCHQSTHREAIMADPFKQIGEVCTGSAPPPKEIIRPIREEAVSGPRNEGEDEEMEYHADQSPEQGDSETYFWFWHNSHAIRNPGPENCQLGHMPGHDPSRCPYCKRAPLSEEDRAALEEADKRADEQEQAKARYSASVGKVFPTVLEASMFYSPQALVQWCVGEVASSADIANAVTGTNEKIKYREKGTEAGGAARWDLAWLVNKGEKMSRSGDETGGWTWYSWAHHVKNSNGSICKMFDFHADGLKDIFYMISTPDNQRRCPEEPNVPMYRNVNQAFVDGATSHWFPPNDVPQTIKTRAIGPLPEGSTGLHTGEMPSRPRECHVEDCEMQRQMDYLLQNGRLRAVDVLVSNRITLSPPLRMLNGQIEMNVGAICDHMSFVVESMLKCANVPGLRNMQERFSKGSTGPLGTSVQSAVAGGKRTASTEDSMHTIPFSYDVTSIALAMEAASRFYNPSAEEHLKAVNEQYGTQLNLNITYNDLPQMSTRFAGYRESNRQTVTLRVPTTRSEKCPDDLDVANFEEEAEISHDHVTRALGREATDEDVARYAQARQGSRNMRGVEGDLFSYDTWQKHAVESLKARGLISGTSMADSAVRMVCDMPTCINARIVEHACECNMEGFADLKIKKATSMCYETAERKEREKENQARSSEGVGKKRKKLLKETDGMGMMRPGSFFVSIKAPQEAEGDFVREGGREDVRGL